MLLEFDVDDFLALVVIALVIVFIIPGCATGLQGDELRVVHPVTWAELNRLDLAIECQDTDEHLRGCVVSRWDGDHIYTLPVCR